jgi:hypothetical protein
VVKKLKNEIKFPSITIEKSEALDKETKAQQARANKYKIKS